MTYSVTSAQLKAAAPTGDPQIIAAIADKSRDVFSRYGISNRNRALGFLSTAMEETGGFRLLSENLNYSAERLVQVWPSRFPNLAAAAPFAHNPQLLADKVYGGRLGNTAPDDGWRFRGQGLIQPTGRSNFALMERLTGLPLVAQPDLATNPDHLLECSVALFSQYPNIYGYCDAGNWRAVWALVGSGRPDGTVLNFAAHQAALAALQKAIVESAGGAVPSPGSTPAPSAPLPPAPLPDAVGPALPKPATSWWGLLWSWLRHG